MTGGPAQRPRSVTARSAHRQTAASCRARVAQRRKTTGSSTSMQATQHCSSHRAPNLAVSDTLIRAPAARPSSTSAPRAAQPTDETAACPYWSGRLVGQDLLGGPNESRPPAHGRPTHHGDADTHRDATGHRDRPGTAAARAPTWLPRAHRKPWSATISRAPKRAVGIFERGVNTGIQLGTNGFTRPNISTVMAHH